MTPNALTISAGEKFPDPRAKERSLGILFFSNPNFSIVSADLSIPTPLSNLIETILIDLISALLKDVNP